jgi:hypothetical protein
MESPLSLKGGRYVKTVYWSTNHAIFSFEVQELINPAISSYTALQLLENGKGQATCLLCNKTYPAGQLTRFPIGAGDSPFNVRIKPEGMLKSLFQRKRRIPGMFGGKGFRCPAGHELNAVTTWIT